MINHLKLKSEFSRNVLTLMTGTTIAQALAIAAAPILTRIYTPEDFGLFAFYFSVVSILAVLATGRYELAIVLPRKRDDAYQIVILSWLISVLVSLLTLVLIWSFEIQIVSLLDSPDSPDSPDIATWLYWIPLSIFLMGIYQSLYYWFNREKEYRNMANSRVVQSSTMVASQIGFGFLSMYSVLGLILGQAIGQAVSTLYMANKFVKNTSNIHKTHKLKQIALAKRYINFPKFLLIAHTMNATSRQSPSIFFNIFFTATTAGFYLLVQRVIGAPITIVGGAVGDVFRQQASKAYAERGECVAEYKSTFKKLLLISIVPFSIFIFIAPDLFAIVFGEDWRIAGEYAQILTPMFFLQFVSRPLANMYLIAEKQRQDLYLNVSLLVITVFPFLLAYYYTDLSIWIVLYIFSFAYSSIYLINLFITYNFSKGII